MEINRRNTSYLKQLVVWVTNLEQSLAASYHPSTDWYRGAEKQQTDTPLTRKTWTSTTNPNFAPHMWNQHEAVQMMIPRSSNIAEGWHHGFHSMLSCSKPTIWKFLTDVKKTKRDWRELPEPCAPKWIRYDQQLQNPDICIDIT